MRLITALIGTAIMASVQAFLPSTPSPSWLGGGIATPASSRELRRIDATVCDIKRGASKMMSTKAPFATEAERQADKGLKVSPTAWKWPKSWPYTGDYFTRKTEESLEINGTPNLSPVYDTPASSALAEHYRRFIPENGAVLEFGASANSYLPDDLPLSKLAGVGINEEEMNANTRLTDRLVQDLNKEQAVPYAENTFDAVIMANSIEFLVKPREVLREAFRVLKPGGTLMISFASKNKISEDRQIKVWGNMNDDQRIWIIGSLVYFSCAEGYENLKGYDLSETDSKGMMAGLTGKTPCHIVQATKAEVPTGEDVEPIKKMMASLWSANYMEVEDKALSVARLNALYERASTDEEKAMIMKAVTYLPAIYSVLQQMGNGIPVQLKALLGSRVAQEYHGTEDELEQLRQGLGLKQPSAEFWAPLGKLTENMQAEDKCLLLAECVPMHAGTADEKQALKEFIDLVPQVIEIVEKQLPEGSKKKDIQLLATDLLVTDFLHEGPNERATFLDWVKGLNADDMAAYLNLRKTYKEVEPAPAEI